MVIDSAVRTNAGGGSVVVTITGTINGDYARVLVYFTGGTPTDQTPSAIIYDRGGVEATPELSGSCSSADANDCSLTVAKPIDFIIEFNNQLINNPVDGSSVILNGSVDYSI